MKIIYKLSFCASSDIDNVLRNPATNPIPSWHPKVGGFFLKNPPLKLSIPTASSHPNIDVVIASSTPITLTHPSVAVYFVGFVGKTHPGLPTCLRPNLYSHSKVMCIAVRYRLGLAQPSNEPDSKLASKTWRLFRGKTTGKLGDRNKCCPPRYQYRGQIRGGSSPNTPIGGDIYHECGQQNSPWYVYFRV